MGRIVNFDSVLVLQGPSPHDCTNLEIGPQVKLHRLNYSEIMKILHCEEIFLLTAITVCDPFLAFLMFYQ